MTAIALALLLIVGFLTSAASRSKREKRITTDRNVTALAEQLDADVERGRYKRISPDEVTQTDSWNTTLRVEYRDEGLGEQLIVRSAGPDGVFDTDDDITARRWLMNAKGIGENIHDGAASVAKETTKGVIQGVKEEVKGTFRRKTTEDPK